MTLAGPLLETLAGPLLHLSVRELEFRRPIPGPAAGGMMTARRMAMMLVGVLALSVVTAAQSKGKTKAQGKVVDEAGQPLGDVIVAAVMEGQDKPFQQAKTNNKGEWNVQNLVAGKWKFFFGGKQGLEETSVDVAVGESGTVTVADVKLGKPVDHDGRADRIVRAPETRLPEVMTDQDQQLLLFGFFRRKAASLSGLDAEQ